MTIGSTRNSAFQTPGSPPTTATTTLLDRLLAPSLADGRRRLKMRVALMAAVVALTLGVVTMIFYPLATNAGGEWLGGSLGVAALSVVVSVLTAVGLSPVLRRRDDRLLQAASSVARHNIELLAVLGKLTELRNAETAGHNLRVAFYTLMFSEALGLSPAAVLRATKGAFLHDIGKLVVPERVLGKPGPLTPAEQIIMQTHVQLGVDLVNQAEVLNDVAPVVACHHEHFDGSGYPQGLKGEAIPLEARIFALIDVFDALTSPRAYKPALSIADALAIMSDESGSHFDPTLFDRFVHAVPTIVRQLPRDEAVLVTMLQERLLHSFDRFTHLEPVLTRGGLRQ